jgi:hypothetical protein
MPIYEGHGFQIERAGWGLEDDEQTLTLTPADIDAALQISGFTSPNDVIDDSELRELAQAGTPPDIIRATVQVGKFHGYRAEYNEEGLHWRVWWLATGRLHLYVTYNCHVDYAGRHDTVVDWMLQTLTPSEAAA